MLLTNNRTTNWTVRSFAKVTKRRKIGCTCFARHDSCRAFTIYPCLFRKCVQKACRCAFHARAVGFPLHNPFTRSRSVFFFCCCFWSSQQL